MNAVNFSIVIPHKNTPELLQRCLDSIPVRDDLHIVIVDDNSDAHIVDFNNFPGSKRTNTEIVFSKGKHGKGPGYARNLGMSKAKGKWIIFSDSDDYFTNSFPALLDTYANSNKEIIFFKCLRHNEHNTIDDYPLINNAIDMAIETGHADSISYGVPCPWGKFIKRDFLQNNQIKYQEITGGDDILFSIRMAIKLKSYAISEERLYCVVDRPGSLTRNNKWRSFYSYSKACLESYKLLKPVAKEKLAKDWLASWWGFLWAENKYRALSLIPAVYNTMGIKNASYSLRKGIKRGSWNWRNA